jgi:hypothetical protein
MSAIKKRYEEFWLGLRVSDSKLTLFRFAFFFVFALDAWLQIGNAPRYGFGDFNVSHLPFLDGILPMPTRASMSVVYGLQVLLGLRIALGGASRAAYVALAVLFAGGYFISQLNSYQHHYLLAIALGLLAAFPWPDFPKPQPASEATKDRFWPIRMLLVALSVMYVFAVLAKLDGEWLDGSTMQRQITEGWIRDLVEDVGWGTAAKLTMVVELSLAVLIHVRKLWPLAIAIGVGMHMAFEFSGLRIGLFSYFMASLYLLLLPESWLATPMRWVAPLREQIASQLGKIRIPRAVGLAVFAVATAAAAALTQSIFIDSVNVLTWCVLALAIGDAALTRAPAAAGIKALIACLGLIAIVHTTDGLRTYYHFWGHNDRRNKDTASAIIHYENVVDIDPAYASGRSRLAASYLRVGRKEDALEQYEEGLVHNPKHFNLNRGAAQLYSQFGQGPKALAAAKRALAVRPKDQVSNQIRQRWEQLLGTDAQN